MLILGLTGAIASGKTTTAAMFAAEGVAVFDADMAVHRLYESTAAAPVEAAFPGVMSDGRVDRRALAARVVGDDEALARLEAIVHPLVHSAGLAFLQVARRAGHRIALLDIPLLFEVGRGGMVHAIVVSDAPEDIRRARAGARPGMTAERLSVLEARQLPAAEKRRRAHFVVDTGRGIEAARAAVRDIMRAMAGTAAAK